MAKKVRVGDAVTVLVGDPTRGGAGDVDRMGTVAAVYDDGSIDVIVQLDRTKDSVRVPKGGECLDGETLTLSRIVEGKELFQWR